MKAFFCIFIISLIVSQEIVFGKRAGPGPGRCCKTTDAGSQSVPPEQLQAYMQECHQEVSMSENQEGGVHGKFACISECMGKKLKIVDSDGKLNEGEFRKLVKTDMARADHEKAMADATVTKCIKEESNVPDKINNCGTIMAKITMCVQRDFFMACPASMQDNSEQCVQMRKMIESGPPK